MKTRVRDIISYLYKTNKILRAVINRTKLKTQHFITEIFCKESYLLAYE